MKILYLFSSFSKGLEIKSFCQASGTQVLINSVRFSIALDKIIYIKVPYLYTSSEANAYWKRCKIDGRVQITSKGIYNVLFNLKGELSLSRPFLKVFVEPSISNPIKFYNIFLNRLQFWGSM